MQLIIMMNIISRMKTSPHQIEILFMEKAGIGRIIFINSQLGKLCFYATSCNIFKSGRPTYTHSKYNISIRDSERFDRSSVEISKFR